MGAHFSNFAACDLTPYALDKPENPSAVFFLIGFIELASFSLVVNSGRI